ncbi:angiopoietin-related protein 3-like [Mixophyes fleayi]|uniref:angiopoietin-related protein 3-like n=1 Tax=Mixophyes fleayi TaxID=3061075 RepID=UPI003F4DF26E
MRRTCSLSVLYSLCFLGPSVQGSRVSQNKGLQAYPREEVNLLSQSLLQIGTGLKREASHTKQQINSIFQQLDHFNTSLAILSGQISQAGKLGEELDTHTRSFEDNDKMYEALAEIYEELFKLQAEGASLDNKIKPLERRIQTALDTRDESSIERQNIKIDALQEIVDSHEDQINAQEEKIKRLLRKANSRNMKDKKRHILGAREKSKA